jgi:hypothetical protein
MGSATQIIVVKRWAGILAGVLGCLLGVSASCAHGAAITVGRSADGQPALVMVDGDLTSSDGDQFRSKTSFLSKAVILFNSDGVGISSQAFKSARLFD